MTAGGGVLDPHRSGCDRTGCARTEWGTWRCSGFPVGLEVGIGCDESRVAGGDHWSLGSQLTPDGCEKWDVGAKGVWGGSLVVCISQGSVRMQSLHDARLSLASTIDGAGRAVCIGCSRVSTLHHAPVTVLYMWKGAEAIGIGHRASEQKRPTCTVKWELVLASWCMVR